MRWLEVGLFIAYLGVLFAITLAGRRGGGAAEYLIGSRAIGWLPTASSMLAVTGGVVLVSAVQLAYERGMSAIAYWVGFAAGMVCLALAARRIKRISDAHRLLTIADFIRLRGGRTSGVVTASFVFIATFGVLTGQLVAAGTLLAPLTGMSPAATIVLTGGVTLGYVMIGGYRAVVRTDVVQLSIMAIVLGLVVFGASYGRVSGEMIAGSSGADDLAAFAGFVALGAMSTITAVEFWQRIYAARDERAARQASLAAAAGFLLFGAALCTIGIMVRSQDVALAPNGALYAALFELAPSGIRELSAILVAAAIMSTIDTELFYLSSSLSNDFLYGGRTGSDDQVVRTTRAGVVVLAAAAMAAAILIDDVLTLVFLVASLLTATSPAVIACLLARPKHDAVLASLCAGGLFLAWLVLSGRFSEPAAVLTLPAALVGLALGQMFGRSDAVDADVVAGSEADTRAELERPPAAKRRASA
jgi:SSS family solute:Na+ symporter